MDSMINCCRGCKERTIEPINCHGICERYIKERDEYEALREEIYKSRRKDREYWEFRVDQKIKMDKLRRAKQ